MNIQYIKTFICVAGHMNFTKAAEELNYTQSTVTAQIQHLESELGFPLFERIGRKNFLTAGGEKFLEYSHEIIYLFQKAGAIQQDIKLSKGVLRIGALESLLFSKLLPVLSMFQHIFPNLEITIKLGQSFELVSLLKQNMLDIIYISNATNTDSALKCCYSHREELVFVTSQGHPLAKKENVSIKDIFNYPFITTEPSGYCFSRLREIATENNCNLQHSITIDSIAAIVSLIEGSANIAFLPKYSIEDKLKNNELKELNSDSIPHQYYYSQLLCSKEKWISPFIDSLISFIKEKYPEE